jgi:hypothetical protein
MCGRALPTLACLCSIASACAGPPVPAAGNQFDGTYQGESHVVRGDGGYICAPHDAPASVVVRNGRFDYIYNNYDLAAPAPIPVQVAADGTFSGQIQYAAETYMRWSGGGIVAAWAMVRGRIAGKALDATVSDYRCARQLQLQIG